MLKYTATDEGMTSFSGDIEIKELANPNDMGSTRNFMFSLSEEMLQDIKAHGDEELLTDKLAEDFLKYLIKR